MTGRTDVEAILARYPRGALTPVQAVMILASELEGAPLDPERADDAAVILRAEVLVAAGEPVRTALALAHAHEELLASRPGPQAAPESVVEVVSFSVPAPSSRTALSPSACSAPSAAPRSRSSRGRMCPVGSFRAAATHPSSARGPERDAVAGAAA